MGNTAGIPNAQAKREDSDSDSENKETSYIVNRYHPLARPMPETASGGDQDTGGPSLMLMPSKAAKRLIETPRLARTSSRRRRGNLPGDGSKAPEAQEAEVDVPLANAIQGEGNAEASFDQPDANQVTNVLPEVIFNSSDEDTEGAFSNDHYEGISSNVSKRRVKSDNGPVLSSDYLDEISSFSRRRVQSDNGQKIILQPKVTIQTFLPSPPKSPKNSTRVNYNRRSLREAETKRFELQQDSAQASIPFRNKSRPMIKQSTEPGATSEVLHPVPSRVKVVQDESPLLGQNWSKFLPASPRSPKYLQGIQFNPLTVSPLPGSPIANNQQARNFAYRSASPNSKSLLEQVKRMHSPEVSSHTGSESEDDFLSTYHQQLSPGKVRSAREALSPSPVLTKAISAAKKTVLETGETSGPPNAGRFHGARPKDVRPKISAKIEMSHRPENVSSSIEEIDLKTSSRTSQGNSEKQFSLPSKLTPRQAYVKKSHVRGNAIKTNRQFRNNEREIEQTRKLKFFVPQEETNLQNRTSYSISDVVNMSGNELRLPSIVEKSNKRNNPLMGIQLNTPHSQCSRETEQLTKDIANLLQ